VPSPILYTDWLSVNGYTFENFTTDDYISFGTALVTEATGNSANTTQSLGELQQAVIEIMRQFSSYSVQYIYQINPDNTLLLQQKSLRTDNVTSQTRAKARLPIGLVAASNIRFTPNPVLIPVQSTPHVL
jgi:hypothetical protein